MNNLNGKGYWTVEEIRPYIIEELKKRFPDSIIRQESGRVDIVVLMKNNNIPVEIQRTRGAKYINVSGFEDETRRQIEQDMEIFEKCWLFLDAKFLEYLRNASNTSISLNMKWLYDYYIEGKVKVFSITKDGIIRELENTDLNILTRFTISNIDKNMHNIEYSLLAWNGFTTEEINDIYTNFKRNDMGYQGLNNWCLRMDSTDREKEYGHICHSLGQLYAIDYILNCSTQSDDTIRKRITNCRQAGLFNRDGGDTGITTFTDEADIAKYFYGYNNNKELWDYLRSHTIDNRILYKVVTGEYPNYLKDRRNQKNIEDAWIR